MGTPYIPRRILQGSDMQHTGANNMSNVIVIVLVLFASVFFFLTVTRLLKAYFLGNGSGNFEAVRWHQHDFLFGGGRHQGLSPSAIAAIPTYTYRRDIMNGSGSSNRWAQCAICLSFLEEGEMVRKLSECKHLFHLECIDKWLNSHATCPLCRSLINHQITGLAERELEEQASTSGIGARVEGT